MRRFELAYSGIKVGVGVEVSRDGLVVLEWGKGQNTTISQNVTAMLGTYGSGNATITWLDNADGSDWPTQADVVISLNTINAALGEDIGVLTERIKLLEGDVNDRDKRIEEQHELILAKDAAMDRLGQWVTDLDTQNRGLREAVAQFEKAGPLAFHQLSTGDGYSVSYDHRRIDSLVIEKTNGEDVFGRVTMPIPKWFALGKAAVEN